MCMGVCTRGAWYGCVWACVHVERGMSVYGRVYTWSMVRVRMIVSTRGACYECVWECVHVDCGMSVDGRVYTWSVVQVHMDMKRAVRRVD